MHAGSSPQPLLNPRKRRETRKNAAEDYGSRPLRNGMRTLDVFMFTIQWHIDNANAKR